jgi:glycosyltransferase involved in cell wall biosynthesis
VEVFVRAAETLKRKYPNVTFKLLGMRGVKNPSAIPDEIMDQWIEEKNVVYLGETRDVIPFINDCTCVVLPSYYREGIPFVLLEGASLKRPIITTNGVGCKEVINDGYNGFICEQKDVDSLALAMDKIINAPIEELNMMGENGRDLVQRKYSLDIVFKQYIETISRYL